MGENEFASVTQGEILREEFWPSATFAESTCQGGWNFVKPVHRGRQQPLAHQSPESFATIHGSHRNNCRKGDNCNDDG
jgi:hypothetical protein